MRKSVWGVMVAVCVLLAVSAFAPTASKPADAAAEQPTVAVQQVQLPVTGLHDEAAMVLVGTVLIGLGSVVRRAA